MITVRALTKKYGEKTVVSNVNLELPRGKLTALVGPNGAGKSTLLGIMSRLIEADSGDVLLRGRNILDYPKRELSQKMAILKQSNHLFVKLSVRQLVSFGRFPHSQGRMTKEDEAMVDEALRYMALEEIADKRIDHLSGGQRQRAFLAMVIAQNADYILLDEPLNNLDMKHAVELMKQVRRLVNEQGKTVVVVIHDINIASAYADQIVALKDGEVLYNLPKEELMKVDKLKKLYDMPLDIHSIGEHSICVYY